MKYRTAIWDHFVIVETKADGKPKTVRCKHDGCDYHKAANQNRMLQHWRTKHEDPEECEDGPQEQSEEELPGDLANPPSNSASTDEPPAKKKQGLLTSYLDRMFTEVEQTNAEMAQAFAVVMNGQSYNSVEQSWTIDFLQSLRKDYVPLTRNQED